MMATAGACFYLDHDGRAFNLNDRVRYFLAARPAGMFGIFSEPQMAATVTRNPTGIYQVQNLKPREIALRVQVRGDNGHELDRYLSELMDALWWDVNEDERGTLRYTSRQFVTRDIRVALRDTVDPDRWIESIETAKGAVEVTLPFLAPDHTFYDPTPVVVTGQFNETTPVTLSCANAGNCDAYPQIRYAGVAVNPKVTDAKGAIWEVENSLDVGETLDMNFDPQELEFLHSVDGDWLGYESDESNLIVVAKGTNDLTFVGDAGTVAPITVTFYPRYGFHG